MALREALARLVERGNLTTDETASALDEIVSGEADPAVVAAFVVALRMKGETADEIVGIAQALRERAVPVRPSRTGLVDTCGTGGDGSHTVNVSTMAALVVAGAGLPVAKHGNVAISSKSGSADVLRELGVSLELSAERVEKCIDTAGIGFMFAPAFHPAFAHVMPVRRAIGVRTAFNVLGPLINPARPSFQLVGTPGSDVAELVAAALVRLGVQRAAVVHSAGADELTLEPGGLLLLAGGGATHRVSVSPEDLGLARAPLGALRGGTPAENAAVVREVVGGRPGPVADCVALNAGAALLAAGAAANLKDGVGLARSTLASGAAAQALDRLLAVAA